MKKTLLIFAFVFGQTLHAETLPTLLIQPQALSQGFAADSIVEAVHQATVASQVAGRIVEMRVDAGQRVRKGDLLARIDAREANEAAAAAQAAWLNAKANYERIASLKQQKFVSQAALDKAKAELDVANANRAATQAGQSHANILAPISGIVARRLGEQGEMATPGKPLVSIYEPGGLRVVASVPQSRLPDMRKLSGTKVELPEQGRWIDATAVTLLPTADAATHVTQVRISLPANADLQPGMFARVHFALGEGKRMTVPQTAIVRRGEITGVYVQASDGRLSLRQLRLGERHANGETEVLAGLAAGESIVTDAVKAGIQLKAGR